MPSESLVHLIDDDEAVLLAIGCLLKAHRIPVQAYRSAREFLDSVDEAAGCVLSDVRMPGMDGIELLGVLGRRGSILPFLVMTGHADVPMAVEAMKAGATDFVEKPFADDAMVETVQKALRLYDARQPRHARGSAARLLLANLNVREGEILRAMGMGQSSKVIAHEMGLSARTVEAYRSNLMSKLQVENATSAVAVLRDSQADALIAPGNHSPAGT